jgi:copper resistance protein B
MKPLLTSSLAATFAMLATPAAAQIPAAPDEPKLMTGMERGGAIQPVMDQEILAHALLNQNEGRFNGNFVNTHYRWSGQGWVGTDYDKLWIKSEGTVKGGKVEDGQDEFLYSRAISTYFDLQGGLRSDLDASPTRNWASFGIQGLAPYFFDLELTGFVSSQGHLAARLEASYDLLITQRLILQPQVEFNVYSKSDPGRGVGPGLSEIDAGLRLRYEFSRKFAPYVGVSYEGKFGQTANFAKRAGESTGEVRLVVGVRIWL